MSNETKGRMGRPPMPPEERASRRLIAKVTEEEEAGAKRRAEMLRSPGTVSSVSSYLRMLVRQDLAAHGLLGAAPSDDASST